MLEKPYLLRTIPFSMQQEGTQSDQHQESRGGTRIFWKTQLIHAEVTKAIPAEKKSFHYYATVTDMGVFLFFQMGLMYI